MSLKKCVPRCCYTQLKKRCRVKSINYWRCDPLVLWEAWKLASSVRHVAHYNNTACLNLLFKLSWKESNLNIRNRNETANLPLSSSQSYIVSHCPSFKLFTRQRFFKRVYTDWLNSQTHFKMCQERILSWTCAKHFNLGNTQEKGVVSETIKLFFFFVFEKIGTVGRWETKHFMEMARQWEKEVDWSLYLRFFQDRDVAKGDPRVPVTPPPLGDEIIIITTTIIGQISYLVKTQ